MLDNKEEKLPEATENQPTENNISGEDKSNKAVSEDMLTNTEEAIKEQVQKDDVKQIKEVVSDDSKEAESAPALDEKSPVEEVAEVKEEIITKTDEKSTEETPPIAETKEKVPEEKKVTQDAVDEVEKQVAKKSENLHEVPEVPVEDYKMLDLAGVVAAIENLMEKHPIQAINKHVEILKKLFNKQFGKLLAEAKTKFLAEGGDTIDFKYENPVQKQYNTILLDYKKKRQHYYNNLKKDYQENLLRKQAIIERLKVLIDEGEASSMYKQFQEVQAQWRATGPVSRDYYADIWRTYHFHVERFYDLLHLSKDLRELDFKHNYIKKLKLVEKAEALAESSSIKAAFDELQILHRMWKEEIGPVSHKYRDEIWERFSNATKKIHDKRHEFFDDMKEKYKDNVIKKEAIIEEIAAYDSSMNKTHNHWQKSIGDIKILRQRFFDIGTVPRNKNAAIWEKFKEATKQFNRSKNNYYKGIKNEQHENLEKKLKLVEQAEVYRESEDWDTATDVMKRIQAEWKTIGHVPRNQSDKIWNRFKEVCNHYFDRLHNKQDAIDEEKFKVYKAKKDFLEELKTASENDDFKPDLDQIKKYILAWREMGVVPKAQRYIDGKFNKFLDTFFDKLSLNKKDSTLLRYRNMIEGYVTQKDYRKLENEVQFVRSKIEGITKEKQQLENNMQFFSNADESNPMIKNILETVEKHKKDLEIWKSKLQYLRSIDN